VLTVAALPQRPQARPSLVHPRPNTGKGVKPGLLASSNARRIAFGNTSPSTKEQVSLNLRGARHIHKCNPRDPGADQLRLREPVSGKYDKSSAVVSALTGYLPSRNHDDGYQGNGRRVESGTAGEFEQCCSTSTAALPRYRAARMRRGTGQAQTVYSAPERQELPYGIARYVLAVLGR